MRIAFLTPVWPASKAQNGIATYVDIMMRALSEQGHECIAIAMRTPDDAPCEDMVAVEAPNRGAVSSMLTKIRYQINGPRWFDYDYWGEAVADALARANKLAPIDIFEAEESFGLARYSIGRTGAPVVLRSHGPHFLVKQPPFEKRDFRRFTQEGQCFQSCAASSFPSEALCEAVRSKYQIAMPNAEAYPNPIDLPDEKDIWRLEDCDRNMVLFVGRFDVVKGADVALSAFSRLAERFPAARFVMAGVDRGIPDELGGLQNFDSYVRSNLSEDVRARIKYLGPVPREEVPALRRQALVSVSASRYETFPYAVTEALAMGAPIVSTQTPGLSEYFEHGRDLLFAPTENAEALSDEIARFLENPDLAAKIGASGRAAAKSILAPDVIARKASTFYRRTLDAVQQTKAAAS